MCEYASVGMQSIGGHNGQPRSQACFAVGHRAVLIDLAALFPTPPHFDGSYQRL